MSSEDAAGATAIRCHHQVQTREPNATGRCPKLLPGESLTGNQIGHVSRLHCLYKAMDQETEGQHAERPHPSDGVSTHTARLAASMKTCTTLSTEILGVQRRTINR